MALRINEWSMSLSSSIRSWLHLITLAETVVTTNSYSTLHPTMIIYNAEVYIIEDHNYCAILLKTTIYCVQYDNNRR